MNMKSRSLHNLLRLLVTALGAGLGAALVAGALSLIRAASPTFSLPPLDVALTYVAVCALGAAILFIFSERIVNWMARLFSATVQKVDSIPASRLMPAVFGLLIGLVIAALISVIYSRMGNSIFTTVVTAITYITMGLLGYTIGYRRSADVNRQFSRTFRSGGKKLRGKRKQKAPAAPVKLIDTSALIDGRVADVSACGFLDGVLVVPGFVVDELKTVAESPDPVRRAKGKRGIEILEQLQKTRGEFFRNDNTDYEDTDDADVKLLRLARDNDAAVITGDYSLNRAAQVSGIRVLSIDSLASALRPALVAGETVAIEIVKEGREASQGVGYLPDGTMVVVDGGRNHVGESLQAQVTSVLQTNAGRMIFARAVTEG